MKRTLALLTPVMTALMLLIGLRVADAKPRVAVAPIQGDDSGDMRSAVRDALDGDELDLVSNNKLGKAIDKLGYDAELTDKQAKKLSKEIEADGLIVAALTTKGSHKILRVKLFVGGKKQKGFKVTFNNEQSDNFKTKLREKIVERIGPVGGDDDDDDKPRKRKGGDDDEDDKEIDEAVARVSPHNPARVAVRADLGMSFKNRTMLWAQRSPATFPQGAKNFKNAFVPGARAEGEVYPLAFSDPKGLAAGIGLFGAYDHVIGNSLQTSREPGIKISTRYTAWWVGARYRISIGSKPAAPSISLGAAYGKRSFVPDRSGLMDPRSLDLPSTVYTMIIPSVGFRIPVARPVALVGDIRVPLTSNAGPIQNTNSYGRAKITAVDALAGVDISFTDRVGLRLGFEFVQYGYAFEGNGFDSNARDDDPASQDVGGLTDRSIGGSATIAVMY